MATTAQDFPNATHYVPPYTPPIPFPGCLAHHEEEAFLPPKEKDPGCFIHPCSIGNLIVRNALADLGESASIMPLSMFKRLGIGKLKPINTTLEMADRTKSIPKGIVENLLVKIDKFIFPVNFVILDMVEDYRMLIILGRPPTAMTHAEVDVFGKFITLEVGNEKVVIKIEDNFNETFTPIKLVCGIRNEESIMDDDLMKIDHDLFLYNFALLYVHDSKEEIDYRWIMLDQGESWEFKTVEEPNGKRDIDLSSIVKPKEDCEDLQNFGDERMELILDAVEARLDDDWFISTIDDEDDLDEIVDYLEFEPHDDFVDINDKAYKERMYRFLGESYTKAEILEIEEIPRTSSNIAAVSAKLMEEMDTTASVQRET
ncbi:serine--tRNA ligase-like protein [Tanacetum coccineum]